jgi:hypothetical protein
MRKVLYMALFINILSMAANAQKIKATGGWNNVVSTTTVTEAGNNYPVSVTTSLASQTFIDLESLQGAATGTANTKRYEVEVSGTGIVWNANLQLKVLRTSDGVMGGGFPTGTISGGTSSIDVSNNPVLFFNGTVKKEDNNNGINVQYELSGFSVLIPAGTYTMSVVYNLTPTY